LIASALLQQLDLDVDPARWIAPEIVDRDRVPWPPHHGIGRAFKVGKEEIVGLIVALERFVARDEIDYVAGLRRRLEAIAARLPDRRTRIVDGRVPVLEVETGDAGRIFLPSIYRPSRRMTTPLSRLRSRAPSPSQLV
jgi:L-seryl-tRNA(Ser) seleniumtransferase